MRSKLLRYLAVPKIYSKSIFNTPILCIVYFDLFKFISTYIYIKLNFLSVCGLGVLLVTVTRYLQVLLRHLTLRKCSLISNANFLKHKLKSIREYIKFQLTA